MIDSENTLNAHLATMPGLPEVAWPNVNAAPMSKPYLDVQVFRNDPVRVTLGGYHRRPGIYQVTVVAAEGQGTGPAGEMAEAIRAHFPADLTLQTDGGRTVRVTGEPQIAGGLQDQGQYRIPVAIPFSDD